MVFRIRRFLVGLRCLRWAQKILDHPPLAGLDLDRHGHAGCEGKWFVSLFRNSVLLYHVLDIMACYNNSP